MLKIHAGEYRVYVEAAQKVNAATDDIKELDQKKKFVLRGFPPAIEQIKEHIEDNFEMFMPYLLYFHEPDLCFRCDGDEFWETQAYINDVFKDKLAVQVSPRETPLMISDDTYTDMLDHNAAACRKAFAKLDAYEQDVYAFRFPLTLERVQSTDPAVNLDRFLPFYLRLTELQKTPPAQVGAADWGLICDFARKILYGNLDFD